MLATLSLSNALLADDLAGAWPSARLIRRRASDRQHAVGRDGLSGDPSDGVAQDCGDAVVLTGVARISVTRAETR